MNTSPALRDLQSHPHHINPVARRMLLRRRLCIGRRCGVQTRPEHAPLRITPRTAVIESDHVPHAYRRAQPRQTVAGSQCTLPCPARSGKAVLGGCGRALQLLQRLCASRPRTRRACPAKATRVASVDATRTTSDLEKHCK